MDAIEFAALDALYRAAKPAHIPGAWVRDAIARIMDEEVTSRKGERMTREDFADWRLDSLLDHLCELATRAREQFVCDGRVDSGTTSRILSVRNEIQARARVAHFLADGEAG